MKTRLSFGLFAALLTVLLIVGLLPSPGAAPAATATATASGTPTYPPSMTPPLPTPSWTRLARSPTSIPLQATYTSAAGETPQMVATSTLLPISTETLILFATMTSTPFGGTATPPVPVVYAAGEKPEMCYKGPSVAYVEVDRFEAAGIVGKDTTETWWYLLVPKGQGVFINCWVAVDQVTTGGNLSGLLVQQPELPQITQVKIEVPGQAVTGAEHVETIECGPTGANVVLHFTGRIFANGPVENVGYAWDTDVPAQLTPERIAVAAWDDPAQIDLALPVPARAGTYFLNLRTTFPMEALGELRFTVRCE